MTMTRAILFALVFLAVNAFAVVAYKTTIATTATGTSTKVLEINSGRKYLIIQNIGANTVSIGTTSQSGTEGIRVVSGGNYEPIEAPVNEIWVKSLSSTSDLIIIEGQ